MRVRRFVLPLLVAVLLPPSAAHATADEGTGINCSAVGPTVTSGNTTRMVVEATWVVPYTDVTSMTMHCELYRSVAAWQAWESPIMTWDATSLGGPVLQFQTTATVNGVQAPYMWCSTVTTTYGGGQDVHHGCYYQPVT